MPPSPERLKELLTRVLDDATIDAEHENARHWSLRSSLRREIMEAIDYKYDSDRSMKDPKYPRPVPLGLPSEWECVHANEVPTSCPCPPYCFCKSNGSCK